MRTPTPLGWCYCVGEDGCNQTYDAVLVGADRAKDLAVLRISPPKEALQPARLGQSGQLHVGQQVLAIGNPFGFDHTLTTGTFSEHKLTRMLEGL